MRSHKFKKQLLLLYGKISYSVYATIYKLIYKFCRREDKIVGSSFRGAAYENNPRFVFEELERQFPQIKKVWICDRRSTFLLPDYVKRVNNKITAIYEYATAKVWIDSHQIPLYITRRDDQLFIEIFHGGLGIKKIANDVKGRENNKGPRHTAENASLYISNADFTNNVIRNALHYKGTIWKCGYPKNDIFVKNEPSGNSVKKYYNIPEDTRILVYMPTYRVYKTGNEVFGIDFQRVKTALEKRFNTNWVVLIHLHPRYKKEMSAIFSDYSDGIIDANDYGNIQELLVESDAIISDYSSCIFEAAEKRIPCFTFATDFEQYKQVQGTYFEMEELPFPCARNNNELIENIEKFDEEKYLKDWNDFADKMGLLETGHASEYVASLIAGYIRNGKVDMSCAGVVYPPCK